METETETELYREFIELLQKESCMAETMDMDKDMSPEPLPLTMTFSEVETMAKHLYLSILLLFLNYLQKKNFDQIVLTYPTVFPLPKRECAPEVLQMKALPFITHKSCSYYSLALLCLAKLNLSLAEMPHVLHGTKLFYFLERCLKEEPVERLLINV